MDKNQMDAQLESGTGFMQGPLETMRQLEEEGYSENLVANFDSFSLRSGGRKAYPSQFTVDKVVRFEYTSDPSDQSALYAISCEEQGWKGLFFESYGTYHEPLSEPMIQKLGHHLN